MKKFHPKENVVEGFRRVAQSAQPKLAQFLLRKAGFASHDIHLLCESGGPLILSRPDVFDEFRFYKHFSRTVRNQTVRLLNASRTSPAVLEVHFFLELPAGSPLVLTGTTKGTYGSFEEYKGQAFSDRKELVESTKDSEIRPFVIPVLECGHGLEIAQGVFAAGLVYDLEPVLQARISNEPDFRPPSDLVEHCSRAFADFVQGCQIWFGVVLDSEELLPYRWRHDEQRYEPGFFSDPTVAL